jgi:negative regulator of flagellin synthesis FlgM
VKSVIHSSTVISAYEANDVTQVARLRTQRQNGSGSAPSSKKSDQVQVSGDGKLLSAATQALQNEPEIREERVLELKKRIEHGEYQVPVEDLASQLLGLIQKLD